nr:hypothetical protein [uncultured Flavobacterium sp.]
MKNKEAKSIFSSLENFSSTPPPELWDKIEAQLDKPKKKKRPVIWWWAAACLVAGLSLPTIWYVNSNQGNNQELIIENNANEVVLQNDSKSDRNANKNIDKKESTIEKASFNEKDNSTNETKNENLNTKETRISLANANSEANKNNPAISSKADDSKGLNKEKNNQLIAGSNDKSQSGAITANKNTTANSYKSASIIGMNSFSQSNSNENVKTIASSENSTIPDSKQNKESVKNTNSKSIPTNQNTEVPGLSANKAIAENTSEKDSLSKIKKEVAQLENALTDLDKDKNKKKTTPEVIDKWSLQVFAGVMGSENFNNDKALGNTVASKQSSGYGVKTNYKLNKKWAVSSGFKINELGQKINGVAYYERGTLAGFTSGALPNNVLDSSSKNNAIVVFVSSNENYLFASNSKSSAGFETGNVTQNLKYFEMPLEISYALLSKKKTYIGLNTGGFVGRLISNDVILNGSSIGENNNVNEFVYGTLLSSTLQYEFYKKTKFFIEPGMNYYINPLENQSFNQFQWMFNVGFNVSF